MCSAQYGCFLEFLEYMFSCFPGVLLTYFLDEYDIVPVAPIITGITSAFTFQIIINTFVIII